MGTDPGKEYGEGTVEGDAGEDARVCRGLSGWLGFARGVGAADDSAEGPSAAEAAAENEAAGGGAVAGCADGVVAPSARPSLRRPFPRYKPMAKTNVRAATAGSATRRPRATRGNPMLTGALDGETDSRDSCGDSAGNEPVLSMAATLCARA